MFENFEIFQMSQAMARHAANWQGAISRNIAHADTPGYRAVEARPFAEVYETPPNTAMRAERPGHVAAAESLEPALRTAPADMLSPNGNSVSVEREMTHAASARHQHDMALSIYRSATGIWRTGLGR